VLAQLKLKLSALARGRYWQTLLDTGRVRSIRRLAEIEGLSEGYIRRCLTLANRPAAWVREVVGAGRWLILPPCGRATRHIKSVPTRRLLDR